MAIEFTNGLALVFLLYLEASGVETVKILNYRAVD
jgi:hypothetical protein